MGRGSGHGAGKTGKSGGSARGNFSLPKKNKKPRPPPAIAKTLEPAPAPKVVEKITKKGPSKRDKRRARKLEEYLASGKVKKSSQTVAELSDMRKGANPGLHHAEVDVMNEAELRSRFPRQGTENKYFQSSKFKKQYILSEPDGKCVAQIIKSLI